MSEPHASAPPTAAPHASDAHAPEAPAPGAHAPGTPRPSGKVVAATSLVLVLAAAAGTATLFLRQRTALARQSDELHKEVEQGPVVRVATVKLEPANRIVALPAEVRAERHATLYAKVSGYVRRVLVERGDKVKQGQVLAEIEAPDLAEQVASAQAELGLRQKQLLRAHKLAGTGFVSQQERDSAEEAVKVSEAALARARSQQGYLILRAPFDGTVTGRFADPGALLPAATGSTSSAQPLLELAQLSRLRVALQLGQDDAARVRVGDPVSLQIEPARPPLSLRVSRLSQSLDPRTRTMLCEIDVVNPPEGLYPGSFVQASITLQGPPKPLVPSDALVEQNGQLFVPTVQDGHVHFQRVRLGMDDGASIEVLEGLRGGELIALNLGTDVPDGAAIRAQPVNTAPKVPAAR